MAPEERGPSQGQTAQLVSLGTMLFACVAVGLAAGYFGGRVDNLLMRFTDIWYAFPDLIFVLVLVSVFGPSLLSIFGAIALVKSPLLFSKQNGLEELSAVAPILQTIAADASVINPVRVRAQRLIAAGRKGSP